MRRIEKTIATGGGAAGSKASSEEVRWDALARRDPGADGLFFYGVKTTGVYCVPSCPSRLPKRENVVFFASASEAERGGFRPCRRCRPRAPARNEPHLETIVRACRRIEAAEAPLPLAELAGMSGLSSRAFHRIFRRIVGVTPKGYAAAARMRKLERRLREGTSVTQAIYDAGYGSASRVYGKGKGLLGMSPSEYRKGGEGIAVGFAIADTFLGATLVAATGRGVCAIDFGDSRDLLVARLTERFPKAELREGDPALAEWVKRTVSFIDNPRGGGALPLDIRGTAFQRRVWEEVRSIPPGETATYGDIARRIGRSDAARAVGRACASNAIAVAIPCHRVVRKDGRPGGYRWGEGGKRALLEREAERDGKRTSLSGYSKPSLDG
jgi:AraC family transcriptional regulator of adaptative response/methylated-DNA-[protein]-cysteine methyltransferase